MVRRLCILCFLVALWPGLALAQSAALVDALVAAFNQSNALYQQGRYAEAESFAVEALNLGDVAEHLERLNAPSDDFDPGRRALAFHVARVQSLGDDSFTGRLASSTSIAAVMQTRSRKVEMPNGLLRRMN